MIIIKKSSYKSTSGIFQQNDSLWYETITSSRYKLGQHENYQKYETLRTSVQRFLFFR
jgi:hypothetical protein